MSDITCGYNDREATLMAYLYDEITSADRAAFDAHLTTCARCRVELNGLGGVRTQLSHWAPPDYRASQQRSVGNPQTSVGSPRVLTIEQRATNDERRVASDVRWVIPAWAQYAAAVLVLGVSVGAANFNIHYDAQNGLNIRTGWSNRTERAAPAATPAADAVSRTELTALEQQLRSEIQAATATPSTARNVALTDGDAQRRFKTLLDENERRHEREMALRIAEVVREVNLQRQSDLVKIDQNLGLINRQNDIEVRKNRQMIDLYMQRVSRPQ
jgi:anti-sigma factor RsiW